MTEQKTSSRMEGGATSSVEIRTSTRGVDIAVKCYCTHPEQPVREAGDQAINEYFRVIQEVQARLMGKAA